jgi:hypothetical protein
MVVGLVIVMYCLAASWFIICAVFLIQSGIRLWRDGGGGHASGTRGMRKQHRIKGQRAHLTGGIFCAFFAAAIISTMILEYSYHGVFLSMPSHIRWVVPISVIVTFLWCGLFYSVLWFNRPRFLVPPHLRGEQRYSTNRTKHDRNLSGPR